MEEMYEVEQIKQAKLAIALEIKEKEVHTS